MGGGITGKKSEDNLKYMGSVKVGQKGQIVIPKEVRDLFGIRSGDTLVLLADAEKGIAIHKMTFFHRIADAILSGKDRELHPEKSDEENLIFAKGIKNMENNGREKDDGDPDD